MSSSARWVICAVFAVLGVIALIYAVIYVSVPIHSLPGFVPGQKPGGGHYHKRALLWAVIGVVLLAIAAFVAWGARRTTAAPAGPAAGPAVDQAAGAGKTTEAGDSPTP
jgi:type VI protein secretion system component VasK